MIRIGSLEQWVFHVTGFLVAYLKTNNANNYYVVPLEEREALKQLSKRCFNRHTSDNKTVLSNGFILLEKEHKFSRNVLLQNALFLQRIY